MQQRHRRVAGPTIVRNGIRPDARSAHRERRVSILRLRFACMDVSRLRSAHYMTEGRLLRLRIVDIVSHTIQIFVHFTLFPETARRHSPRQLATKRRRNG